jgi:uncharacterized delta-60 repeat protein
MRKIAIFIILMLYIISIIGCKSNVSKMGILDPSFGNQGIVENNSAMGNSMFVDNEGKIYVTGWIYKKRYLISKASSSNYIAMIICRYNNDGTLDKTFGEKGCVIDDGTSWGYDGGIGNSIKIDNNGKIYVVGYMWNNKDNRSNYDMALWRYNNDGSLDKTFGKGGVVIYNRAEVMFSKEQGNDIYIEQGNDIYIDNSGKIYVTGYIKDYGDGRDYRGISSKLLIWKYNEDGALDKKFGNNGIVTYKSLTAKSYYYYGNSIYVDSNKKIYVVGYSWNRKNYDMIILKYNNDGTLDKTFGSGGIVSYNNAAGENWHDYGNSMYVDSNGKIYVVGSSWNGKNFDMVIWKYNNDGSLDNTFGKRGYVVNNNAAGGNGDDKGKSIFVDNNGKIYVTGKSWNGFNFDMVIWRYNSDGSLDKSFGKNGVVVYKKSLIENTNEQGNSIYVDNFQRIYVTGFSESNKEIKMFIWRYK